MTSKQTTTSKRPASKGSAWTSPVRKAALAGAPARGRLDGLGREVDAHDVGGARPGEQRAAVADAAAGVEHRAARDELRRPAVAGEVLDLDQLAVGGAGDEALVGLADPSERSASTRPDA